MKVLFIILASVFALLTVSENKIEYKKIFSNCFFVSAFGMLVLQLIQTFILG